MFSLLDTIFPRFCIGCGKRLQMAEKDLCLMCMANLPRTRLWQHPHDNHLARTYWGRTGGIEVEKVVAWLGYAPATVTASMVHAFKYRGRRDLARNMGALMASELALAGFFEGIDGIVPVPLTKRRKFQRGYNQAHCLAEGIRKVTGLPVEGKVLKRRHFSQSQTMITTNERNENVRDAFEVRKAETERLRGRHLLVLDDVITTGATTLECCRMLARIPDVKLSILGFSAAQSVDLRMELYAPVLQEENQTTP